MNAPSGDAAARYPDLLNRGSQTGPPALQRSETCNRIAPHRVADLLIRLSVTGAELGSFWEE
jgi:hypothetical protein